MPSDNEEFKELLEAIDIDGKPCELCEKRESEKDSRYCLRCDELQWEAWQEAQDMKEEMGFFDEE